LAQDGIIDSDKSWLSSCVAHTMKRFCHSIKPLIKNPSFYKYVCYLFSLLVNSTSLGTISNYFKKISVVLLSPNQNDILSEALEFLKKELNSRSEPEKKLIKNISNSFEVQIEDQTAQRVDEVLTEIESTFKQCEYEFSELSNVNETIFEDIGFKIDKKSDTIKSLSPFYSHFKKIELEVKQSLECKTSVDTNQFHNVALFNHLIENFMPYCFIWSGFTFVEMDTTRLTNGSIENFNRFLKLNVSKNVLPHAHINNHSSHIIGNNIEYLKQFNKMFLNVKRKGTVTIKDKQQFEENIHEAIESYSKKLKLDIQNDQGYQTGVDVDKLVNQISNPSTQSSTQLHYKINGLIITHNDLFLLEKKRSWLNEILIEAYLSLFVIENKTFIITSSTAYNILIEGIFELGNKIYNQKNNLSGYKSIVGAVLINNNHWNCFFVDLENGQFIYLDPKTDEPTNELKAFDNWNRYTNALNIKKEWKLRSLKNVTRQKDLDNYNCGVYVCQYLKLLLSNNFNLCFLQKNSLAQLDIVRCEMLNELKSKIFN
ncbi:unnamed protein product, partial [Brachionus calyciflorus]